MKFIVNLLVSALSIYLAAILLPGINVAGFGNAILVAVLLGLLNSTLGLLLKILTFPINFLSLGLLGFLINTAMVCFCDSLLQGFEVVSFWNALIFALFVSFVNPIINQLFTDDTKRK